MDHKKISNVFNNIENQLEDAWVYRWANGLEKQKFHFKNELANVINTITRFTDKLIEAWFNEEYIEALNTLHEEIESWRWSVHVIDWFLKTIQMKVLYKVIYLSVEIHEISIQT